MGATKRAVIIGGGLGGLAAALRLAKRGLHVTVCEGGPRMGGKMNHWEAKGFEFDTGPSLITMPWVFADLFAAAGHRLEDHIELATVDPLAHYVFADGTVFDYSASLPEWLDTIRALEPADVDGFLRYMHLGARLYALSKDTFLCNPATRPPDARARKAMRHFPLRNAWGNYHGTVRRHFRNEKLRHLYDRYPTYVGSSPHRCPATLSLIPYLEYAYSPQYVKGGLYRLVEALTAIAEELGVVLRTEAAVSEIAHARRRVNGVRLENAERLAADLVVMNGDAGYAPALLGTDPGAELPSAKRSLSGLVLLVAVRRDLPELRHHNVYFTKDYDGEFRQLFDERRFPDDPTVYVNVPSRSDRTRVPGRGETLFLMANAPADDAPWDEAFTQEARRRVFARLEAGGFPDIRQDIVAELAVTPRWMAQRYRMPGGAIYGSHSHGWRHAFFRPPNKDRRYKGLYYVGGSTHPGGGTPIVLLSAEIACRLIDEHEDL